MTENSKLTIYQSRTTVEVLERKRIEGSQSIGNILKRGDFGIGTTHNLIGEFVILDGECYFVSPQGAVSVMGKEALVPFALVTHYFSPKATVSNKRRLSYKELLHLLETRLVNSDVPHAIKISGQFKEVTVRSLAGVVDSDGAIDYSHMNENRFVYHDLQGHMVGFYLPEQFSRIAATGFHFHFIDNERSRGGHLYDAQPQEIEIALQPASEFTVGFPEQ